MAWYQLKNKVAERHSAARVKLLETISNQAAETYIMKNTTRLCFDEWDLIKEYGQVPTHAVLHELESSFAVHYHVPVCSESPTRQDCENSFTCIDWAHRRAELNR